MVTVVGIDIAAVKRVTCRGCASILEYTTKEVQVQHGTDYGGGSDGTEWVNCPSCGGEAIVKSW
jgi:RNase P subunit RPR2